MKKFYAMAIALLLAGSVQAKPPEEKVVLLVGTTPEARQQATNVTQSLVGYGPFEVLEFGSNEAPPYSLDPKVTYLIRQVGDQVVWQRPVVDGGSAWSEFRESAYDVEEGELLGWTRVEPRQSSAPLTRDELVELYAGGVSGLKVEVALGGQTVLLFEEKPGYYSGAYRVTSEDRVDAKIAFVAQDAEGAEQRLEAGTVSLQGLQTPRVTGLGQATVRDWIIQGEASPGSDVEVEIAIKLGGLFGSQTKRRTVEAFADETGKFEAVATLGTLTSSPKGTIKVKATSNDGVVLQGSEQEVRFRSRVVYRYDPWGYGPGLWGSPFYGRRRLLGPGCR